MWIAPVRLLLATLWSGSLWAVGYLAAPTLFTVFDRKLAGTVAASLFRSEAWLSVACAVLLLSLQMIPQERSDPNRRQRTILIVAMLACTLIGYFCLQPFMAELRVVMDTGSEAASAAHTRFAVLHGVSAVIYLAGSLLGVVLVLKSRA